MEKRGVKRIRSIEQIGIHNRMGVSFLLASVTPLLCMCFLVHFLFQDLLPSAVISYLQWIIFLMVCASVIGFYMNQKVASAVSSMAKKTKEIVEKRAFGPGTLAADDNAEEINELAKTFNRVTQDLEQKILSLERSKKLIQDLFRRVGEAITTTEKVDHLMMLVIESMVTALDAESGVLMLEEPGEGIIKTKLAYGVHQESLCGLTIRKGEGAFGWVVEKGKSLTAAHSTHEYQLNSKEIEVSYRSLLCVPLRYQGKIAGLVAVINKKQNEGFNNDEQTLLENVADQVAVAIENARLNQDAEKIYFETISALAMAVEAKDAYTRGHLKRVSEYVERLARLMDFDEKSIRLFKDGAFLHDLGKIAIPDNILLKTGKLSAEEMEVMKEHTIIGENIIAPLSSFKDLRAMVRHHQEWFDGSGYPDHLRGDDIPIGARILAVADVYDALTTDRPYRKALPHHVAMELIHNEAGTHFDPAVVRAFSKMMGDSKDFIASAA